MVPQSEHFITVDEEVRSLGNLGAQNRGNENAEVNWVERKKRAKTRWGARIEELTSLSTHDTGRTRRDGPENLKWNRTESDVKPSLVLRLYQEKRQWRDVDNFSI